MRDEPRPKAKRPYRPPRLVRYGDLYRLTRVKGGASSDGGGKPTTRSSGGAS